MTSIQIPGYKVLAPNTAWGGKAKPMDTPLGEMPAMHIIYMQRYAVPSGEQIAGIVKETAKRYWTLSPKERDEASGLLISEMTRKTPDRIIKEIACENQDLLAHLMEHYKPKNAQQKRKYLSAMHGTIPASALERHKEEIEKAGQEIYRFLIRRTSPDEWALKIRLGEEWALPDRLEMDYLLARGVRDCDVFKMEGNYEYEEAANSIRRLFHVFPSAEEIGKITDVSEIELESLATQVLDDMISCNACRIVIGGLTGILAGIGRQGNPKRGLNIMESEN